MYIEEININLDFQDQNLESNLVSENLLQNLNENKLEDSLLYISQEISEIPEVSYSHQEADIIQYSQPYNCMCSCNI